ncbi:MAG: hypothetical protein RLY94_14, partial [Chloroflexota bacterium]
VDEVTDCVDAGLTGAAVLVHLHEASVRLTRLTLRICGAPRCVAE